MNGPEVSLVIAQEISHAHLAVYLQPIGPNKFNCGIFMYFVKSGLKIFKL